MGCALDRVLDWIGTLPYALRLLFCFVLIFPPAFLMGFPMPTAMTSLARLGKDHMFLWAWGINGCFSVVGAALVPVIATSFGLAAVLIFSGCAYLLAIFGFFAVLLPLAPPEPRRDVRGTGVRRLLARLIPALVALGPAIKARQQRRPPQLQKPRSSPSKRRRFPTTDSRPARTSRSSTSRRTDGAGTPRRAAASIGRTPPTATARAAAHSARASIRRCRRDDRLLPRQPRRRSSATCSGRQQVPRQVASPV